MESLVSAEGNSSRHGVFVNMFLVVIEPNKRENPGLVTKGTSLLLGMLLALKYSCQMIKITELKAASFD